MMWELSCIWCRLPGRTMARRARRARVEIIGIIEAYFEVNFNEFRWIPLVCWCWTVHYLKILRQYFGSIMHQKIWVCYRIKLNEWEGSGRLAMMSTFKLSLHWVVASRCSYQIVHTICLLVLTNTFLSMFCFRNHLRAIFKKFSRANMVESLKQIQKHLVTVNCDQFYPIFPCTRT